MGQANTITEQPNDANLVTHKNNVYKAALTDDYHQFSHFYNLLTANHPEILLDIDFIVWILTTAIHKRSMNILRFIKFDTDLLNNKKIFDELIEDILSQHDLRETDTLFWVLQNGPELTVSAKQSVIQFLEKSALGKGKLQKILDFLRKEIEPKIETETETGNGPINPSFEPEELVIFHNE